MKKDPPDSISRAPAGPRVRVVSGASAAAPAASAIPALLFFLCSFLWNAPAACGGEIDRLIAAVNGRVLTEGDLALARNLNAVVFYARSAGSTSRKEEISQLIDLELMRQELKNFDTPEDESRIDAQLQSLRDAYAGKGGLLQFLRQLGLQESELISYLRLQAAVLKFVDFRFRPFVRVSKEEIQAYYATRLTPQLQKAGLDLPALEPVSSRIEEILREEKVNAVLEQWMKDVRRNSRIEYFDAAHEYEILAPERPNQ